RGNDENGPGVVPRNFARKSRMDQNRWAGRRPDEHLDLRSAVELLGRGRPDAAGGIHGERDDVASGWPDRIRRRRVRAAANELQLLRGGGVTPWRCKCGRKFFWLRACPDCRQWGPKASYN